MFHSLIFSGKKSAMSARRAFQNAQPAQTIFSEFNARFSQNSYLIENEN